MIIKNAKIHNAVEKEPFIADILIEDGKIKAIEKDIKAEGEVLDAEGRDVYPGLVEAHCHVGLNQFATYKGNGDINEKNDILTPHLRAIDGFNPFNPLLKRALEAGITTIGVGPGSANIVGGTFMSVKTQGTCVDDMIIKEKVAMKCAFGENPKTIYGSKSDASRMTTAAKLRELLFNARDYLEKKEAAKGDASKMPKFDMKLEGMIPVMKKEIPLKAHAHRADDICTAIRIAKEFDVKLTIDHCTEGHLIVEELKRANVPVAIGPSMCNSSKPELANKTFETPGILSKAGVTVSITTDAPVTQLEHLPVCAGLAVKHGMDAFEALKAITINPAKQLGIEDRVGSIEVGKDADLVITDGDILVSLTNVVNVILDGKIVK